MVNHGIVTCGASLPEAVLAAVLLERACRTNMRALAAGGPRTWSSDEEALAKRARIYSRQLLQQAWDYFVRRVGAHR
jgi:ribulose-5-phosphate 4-epimerase/fuculose-1-phosphate aldolase